MGKKEIILENLEQQKAVLLSAEKVDKKAVADVDAQIKMWSGDKKAKENK